MHDAASCQSRTLTILLGRRLAGVEASQSSQPLGAFSLGAFRCDDIAHLGLRAWRVAICGTSLLTQHLGG